MEPRLAQKISAGVVFSVFLSDKPRGERAESVSLQHEQRLKLNFLLSVDGADRLYTRCVAFQVTPSLIPIDLFAQTGNRSAQAVDRVESWRAAPTRKRFSLLGKHHSIQTL
jgi:hypothetical protein